jgi:hypothetical protein
MDVNPNSRINWVSAGSAQFSPHRGAAVRKDEARFDQTQALDESLSLTPDLRADVIAQAKDKVSLAPYPPADSMARIARLLGIHLAPEIQASEAGPATADSPDQTES